MLKEGNDNSSVTIDSSVIVAYLLKTEKYSQVAEKIWEEILSYKVMCHQPIITLLEISSAVKRRTGNSNISELIIEELRSMPNVLFHDFNRTRLHKAIKIVNAKRIKSLDAIFVQVSREFETEFITFDKELIDTLKLKNYLHE